MRKSKSRSARRSARRSRSMRGGRLTGDSSYSTYINSDNTSNIAGTSGAALQNSDRNSSSIAGEGAPINMSSAAYQGLIPPQAYYGGKRRGSKSRRSRQSRRSRKMRGGVAINALQSADLSEAYKSDFGVTKFEGTHSGLDLAQMSGGRRRRRRQSGGREGKGFPGLRDEESAQLAQEEAAVFDNTLEVDARYGIKAGGRSRRRRRSMRGGEEAGPMPTKPENDKTPIEGMYDPPQGPGSAPIEGGRRRKRRGGGIIATAALPFGLFGLQKLFQNRSHKNKSRKHR